MPARHILIFFSDTGGGHRAAAAALRDAFQAEFPSRFRLTLIDGFKDAAPFPLNHIPDTYLPLTTYGSGLWGWMFHSSNSPTSLALSARLDDLLLRRSMARVLARHNPDLVISVHPLLNRAPRNAFQAQKPYAPFVTVVTDLFDAHAMWFSAASDLVIVPTQGAFERGLQWHFPAARMRVIGQPISLQFAAPPCAETTAVLRQTLQLRPDLFTVLLVGGGEGMGPLRAIAHALDAAQLPIQLVIIAGRNQALYSQLTAQAWHMPVSVQGFVTNMPDWLRASDVVITKAGPGTIMETLAAGKPLILSGNLPGQEEGNVQFVEQSGVGVLRRTPADIAAQLRDWVQGDPQALEQMRQNARRAARPQAALEIVRIVADLLPP